MKHSSLYFIGIQILFLSHAARSFVLLTANMEDVKKIARKFVSDSIADKIAEFVVKAAEQMVTNVSQENEDNDLISNQYNENEQYNIARQGDKETTTRDIVKDNETPRSSFDDQYETKSTTRKDWNSNLYSETAQKSREKEIDEVMPQSNKEHVKYEVPKSDIELELRTTKKSRYNLVIENKQSHIRESHGPPKSHEQQIQNQNLKNSRYIQTINPAVGSTQLESDAISNDVAKTYPRYERPVKRGHKLIGTESKESLPNKRNSLYVSAPTTLKGFNVKKVHLTTEWEKNEFDQYDNPKYPKVEYIATSGPVALPKVRMQKPWWEKELPADDYRKSWSSHQ